jgi:hypothetical protein
VVEAASDDTMEEVVAAVQNKEMVEVVSDNVAMEEATATVRTRNWWKWWREGMRLLKIIFDGLLGVHNQSKEEIIQNIEDLRRMVAMEKTKKMLDVNARKTMKQQGDQIVAKGLGTPPCFLSDTQA